LIGFTEAELRENYIDAIKVYCEEDYIETELFQESPTKIKTEMTATLPFSSWIPNICKL